MQNQLHEKKETTNIIKMIHKIIVVLYIYIYIYIYLHHANKNFYIFD